MKPAENWIKPGVSVTSVEKKINKPSHSGAESDSDNDDSDDDDDEYNKKNNVLRENEEKIVESTEINETDDENVQKMDVDDSEPPKVDTIENSLVKDETMQD